MRLSIVEWQILASTLFVLPLSVAVLVAFLRGSFKDTEQVKHIVAAHNEKDYWDSGGCDKHPPL